MEKFSRQKIKNIIKLIVFIIIICIFFKYLIVDYNHYILNDIDNIDLTDDLITEQLNSRKVLLLGVAIVPIPLAIIGLIILVYECIHKKANKKIYFCICLAMLFIIGIIDAYFWQNYINYKEIEDWKITTDVVTDKSVHVGGKHNTNYTYYIELKNFDDTIAVSKPEYNLYLEIEDKVYVIYNEEDSTVYKIFSPKQYNYSGKKISKKIDVSNNTDFYESVTTFYKEKIVRNFFVILSLLFGVIVEFVINIMYKKDMVHTNSELKIRKWIILLIYPILSNIIILCFSSYISNDYGTLIAFNSVAYLIGLSLVESNHRYN